MRDMADLVSLAFALAFLALAFALFALGYDILVHPELLFPLKTICVPPTQ